MRRIIVIAKNTFKETIRDRIMYGILIFSLLFLFSVTVIGSLSLGEDLFIIRSFGLAGIYLFGLIITLFLGASLIYKEVEFDDPEIAEQYKIEGICEDCADEIIENE